VKGSLEIAENALARKADKREIIPTSRASAPADSTALSSRVEALCASCSDVLVFGYKEFYRMRSFVNRYPQAPVRFAIEATALIEFLSRTHNNLEGRLLEELSKLFAQTVPVYVYPTATSAMQDSLVSA